MQKHNAGKSVSVVMVLHNSEAVITQSLNSIPQGIKVYVVDNASDDGSVKLAKQLRPDAVVIASKQNIGFGPGNNLALKQIVTEFALLLNPDTILNDNTLEGLLVAAGRYSDAAIIAPVIYNEDGSLQKTYKKSVFSRETSKSKYINPEGDLCAECLSGAAMLLRLSYFRKIGFFDPKIFLFYEDDDLCLQVRKAGYSLVQTIDASLIHLMGRSSPQNWQYIYKKNWHMMWSRLYLEEKYNGRLAMMNLAMKQMLLQCGKALGHLLIFDSNKAIKSIARLVAVMGFLWQQNSVNN